MKMKLIVLALLIAAPSIAQEQSHIDAARELLVLMDADRQLQQTYDQLLPQMQAMSDQIGITEEQRPVFDRYLARMVEVMKEEMSWEKMEPQLLKAYVAIYSEQELVDLAEFYASPLGQKFVAKMPELMEASMAMAQDMMQRLIPRIQAIQEELRAEIALEREALNDAE